MSNNAQFGDVLLRSLLGFEIDILSGLVQMDGGFETAAQLSLFGGNFDDDGRTENPEEYWGNVLETEPAFKYRSRVQYILQFIPATTANLTTIERAAQEDLAWFLSSGIASSVTVVATIPGKNRVNIAISILSEGEIKSFSFTPNWSATETIAAELAFDAAPQRPPPTVIPPGPDSVPGLVLWLDAADATTITVTIPPIGEDSGNPKVDQWNDKSSRADTFFPYDVSARAEHGNEFQVLNGQPVMVFPDFADTALVGTSTEKLPGSGGYTTFSVIANRDGPDGQILGKGSLTGTTEYSLDPFSLKSQTTDGAAPATVGPPTDQVFSLYRPAASFTTWRTADAAIGITGDMSHSLWIKLDDFPVSTTRTYVAFVISGPGTAPQNSMELYGTRGASGVVTTRIDIYDQAGNLSSQTWDDAADPVLTVGRWVNLGFTFTSSTGAIKIFTNGVAAASVSGASGATTGFLDTVAAGRSISLGSGPSGEGGDCIYYQAHFWNKVLLDSEFSAMYNGGDAFNVNVYLNGLGLSYPNHYVSGGTFGLVHSYLPGIDLSNPAALNIDHVDADFLDLTIISGPPFGFGNIEADYPETGGGVGPPNFSQLFLGDTGITPKILRTSVDGAALTAIGFAWRNGVQTDFEASYVGFKPAPRTPDVPSPPHAVGGKFNGLANPITARFVGSIAEIIVYDRVLSPAEHNLVDGYLSVKWGIIDTAEVIPE